jgi:hypothetical protein
MDSQTNFQPNYAPPAPARAAAASAARRWDCVAVLTCGESYCQVDNYGECHRTKNAEAHGVDRQLTKTRTLRKYKFCLAFENSEEEDYVTEKIWQCIAHGGIPVVLGPPSGEDYRPAGPDSLLALHPDNQTQVDEAMARVRVLMNDTAAWHAALAWKTDAAGPSDSFRALLDLDVVRRPPGPEAGPRCALPSRGGPETQSVGHLSHSWAAGCQVSHTCRACVHAADRLTQESEGALAKRGGAEWGQCVAWDPVGPAAGPTRPGAARLGAGCVR